MILTTVNVLDHGHIRLIDVMGDDLRVVNAARVSFHKEAEWMFSENKSLKPEDSKLINFLAKHNHWSPFSHCQLTFEVKCPMLVKNQWYKHRIGMSYTEDDELAFENEGWNEMSMRYVAPEDFYVPDRDSWRSAPENKKQGSGEPVYSVLGQVRGNALRSTIERGISEYILAIDRGIAPEQARLYLPAYSMYTSFYWTVSLFGVIRFLQLRLPKDAQWEIRQYAKSLYDMVYPLFPYSLDAFQIGVLR